jgi:hypothetical protein
MMKTFTWITLLLFIAGALAAPPRAAMAQTEPESTPAPLATPVQPEEAYPLLPPPTNSDANATPYIAPTTISSQPPSTVSSQPPSTVVSVIGDGAGEATAVPSLPISQSTLVRNRAILWAGFLITLLIFLTAVYGAILMYRRRR